MQRLVYRCGKLQQIGNRIIANEKNKLNLYSTPTHEYDDYIQHQNDLITEFKTEVENLYKNIKKHEDKFDSLKIGSFKN